MKTRLHNLDYLRGLCALSIMGYHYTIFAYETHFSPDDFMQKIGLYGVSVFYVLSGLTLFHVYSGSMKPDRDDVIDFFIKRGFRIMPLLWAVVLYNTVLWFWPGWETILLTLTGLFSLVMPNNDFGTGIWSIGNELAFYLLFPIMMLLFRKSKVLLAGFALGVLACYCYFAYHVFPGFGHFHKGAWAAYVNPLNQAFLFVAGFGAGALLKGREVKNSLALSLLLLSVLVFAFCPVQGADALALVQGNTRMLYTLLSVLICLAAYKVTVQLPAVLDTPLRILGEISYSLYLLHAVVWFTVEELAGELYLLPVEARLLICVPATFVLSYLSYAYFERYFIRLGRRVSAKLTYKPEMEVVK
ncbi:acyltransferase [Pontibacter saemangeumensis]|uniref:Acyltransferase n=1 Tax=Pontibacter saemangeumensis TaxID=1084525 RepID=A0ABP8LSM4_9BACT